jgi:hypothetical protein
MASFSVTGGTHHVGQVITFRALRGGYDDYSWDFGDSVGSGRTVRHAFASPGTYDVLLTVTDSQGQAATADKFVKVTVLRGDQLPTIAGPSAKSRKDPTYTKIATSIAGAARAVFCWNGPDWAALEPGTKTIFVLGYIELRSPRQINLSPPVCKGLDLLHYLHRRPTPTVGLAMALLTLGHELTHTVLRAKHVKYQPQEEAFANCVGLQLIALVSYKLGTPATYGYKLARVMWNWWKPSHFPPGYWSAKCRSNGPWDLNQDDPAWP